MTGSILARRATFWLLAAAFVGWALCLRPTVLGGPASYVLVAGSSMEPTLVADTLVVALAQPAYAIGDVVVFRIPSDGPAAAPLVIHRIASGSAEQGFRTRGDNMTHEDPWLVGPAQVVGKGILAVPNAAPALVLARSPIVFASLMAGVATYLLLGWAGNMGSPATRDRAAPTPRRVAQSNAAHCARRLRRRLLDSHRTQVG